MSAVPPQGALRQRRKPYDKLAYRKHVASLPCLSCGRTGCQAAHISVGNYARGMRADDWFCIPLCADRPGEYGCHSAFDLMQTRFAAEHLKMSIDELKRRAKANWLQWERNQ